MPDVIVHLIDFPKGKVHEAVTENADGSYSVFIDARLSNDGQLREYEHALKHIESGDFEKDDVQLIETRDYIQCPKENGYRSLHLLIEIPVFLREGRIMVPVEVQIRTIAMDTWASLEHELKYKRKEKLSEKDELQLLRCAEAMAEVDRRMQDIHKELK